MATLMVIENRKDLDVDVEHIFAVSVSCYFVFLLMISACDHCMV